MYRPEMNEQTIKYKWLVDLIPTGRNEAVPVRSLCISTGYTVRFLKYQVLKARKNGILICYCESGYYFPKDPEELTEYIKRRERYVKTACIALQPFRKAAKKGEKT